MLPPKTLRTLVTARPSRVLGEGYSDDLIERKRLYRGKHWRRVRAEQLAQQPYCAECLRRGRRTPASVVDHVEGHLDAGWRERFFRGPFESLCVPCHQVKVGLETGARRRAGR
jgi:hypothetical protein